MRRPDEFYTAFVSYSSVDETWAEALDDALQSHGVATWRDRHSLSPGDDVDANISYAIERADRLILLMSRSSLQSWWVERELERATDKERRLWTEGRLPRGLRIIIPVDLDGYVAEGYAGKFRSQLSGTNAVRLTNAAGAGISPDAVGRIVEGLRVASARREPLPDPKL